MNETVTGRNVTFYNPKVSTDTLIIMCVFMTTLTLTLVTNVITVLVIIKTPSLRTTTNMFVVSLSTGDALYAMFMFGVSTAVIMHFFMNVYFNPSTLQLVSYFAWGILIHSSIGNLILVSVERWLYIIYPFWYQRHMSVKVVLISIAITWVSAVTVNLPYVFRSFASRSVAYFATWHGYVYPTIHTFCCLLLAIIYTHIAVTTFQQLNKISKLKPQIQQVTIGGTAEIKIPRRSFQVENWKAIKLIIMICGLYCVFVSPYTYFFSYTQLNPMKAIQLYSWNTPFLILLSVYHCSNFFVYALRTRQFRRALQRDLRKLACCRSNRVGSNMDRATSVFELQSRTQRVTEMEGISQLHGYNTTHVQMS